jgi:hypothetical protein
LQISTPEMLLGNLKKLPQIKNLHDVVSILEALIDLSQDCGRSKQKAVTQVLKTEIITYEALMQTLRRENTKSEFCTHQLDTEVKSMSA